MKKMIKTLSLVTALAMMVCAMSVAVLAADEEDGTQDAVTTAAEDAGEDVNAEEDAPQDVQNDGTEGTVVNESGDLNNPSTGIAGAPVAILALAGASLAGAAVCMKKK